MTVQDDVLVTVKGLSKRFDISDSWLNRKLTGKKKQIVNALVDVNFEIRRGETFALVGESGSGKSTLARIISGLLSSSSGEVAIGERRSAGDARVTQDSRSRIQMVFQSPYASLNPRWRVERIVAEPIRTLQKGVSRERISQEVARLLRMVGMHPDDGRKFPHQFSGGQRQRVAIARALASDVEFIVCDEPTSALDVSVQAQILNLMQALQKRLGLTYLFISHDLAVVRHVAARVGVLYMGRIVEIGDKELIFGNPRHPYTRMLMDAVPHLEGSGGRKKRVIGEIPSPINPPSGCAFHPRCPLAVARCRINVPELIGGVACHVVNSIAPADAGDVMAAH
ncbi:ABC transporter ATP-binding protein [Mesorhizobium sp. INR15]|uniref:ABC transporter ATP-binding protein n=1 Tax=Mesorhizobium sp. INR15 TaxID=2654248 RepID=UPI00189647B9|nr:oligopeptide/dipeptide ABC transporter ATP-binding protein [Mesorhizobium sp. INR15]QPC95486.1 ATP-binding cassette domain-containing protein [Mesorhizobium sp. INR15]